MVSITRAGRARGPKPGVPHVLIALLVALAPAAAAAQPAPSELLRAIAAQVFIVNPTTAKNAVCQGYVAEVRPPYAYVATAKHCIADLSLRPLANGTPLADYGVRVTVRFGRGPDAAMTALIWNNTEDIAVVVAQFDPSVRPDSYADLCPACKVAAAGPQLRAVSWVFLTSDTVTPSLEAGAVTQGPGGRYVWEHGCGAPGAPVLDASSGNLIGIFSGANGYPGDLCGAVTSTIAPGATVQSVLGTAIQSTTQGH